MENNDMQEARDAKLAAKIRDEIRVAIDEVEEHGGDLYDVFDKKERDDGEEILELGGIPMTLLAIEEANNFDKRITDRVDLFTWAEYAYTVGMMKVCRVDDIEAVLALDDDDLLVKFLN